MPTIEVPLNDKREELLNVEEFVPPLATLKVPVTCDERLMVPLKVPKEMQLFAMAKHPAAIVIPVACVDVAVPVWLKFSTLKPPLNVELAVVVEFTVPK